MKLPNEPRVLAATYNRLSKTKMISFLVDFPTAILPELRTHRIVSQGSFYEHLEINQLSLSANSSRAIPSNKYLEKTLKNPFIPLWTKQKKGMTGDKLDDNLKDTATSIWLSNLYENNTYQKLLELEIHKQNINRLLNPYSWTTCILSGTEWDNFFDLRCPKYRFVIDGKEYIGKSKKEIERITGKTFSQKELEEHNLSTAQPEFQFIAEILYDLFQEQKWEESKYHVPFKNEIINLYGDNICDSLGIKQSELDYDKTKEKEFFDIAMDISASMCAKLSYDNHEREESYEKHLKRTEKLIEDKHFGPFEHQAIAMSEEEYESMFIQKKIKTKNGYELIREKGACYNLRGFISKRYILENL